MSFLRSLGVLSLAILGVCAPATAQSAKKPAAKGKSKAQATAAALPPVKLIGSANWAGVNQLSAEFAWSQNDTRLFAYNADGQYCTYSLPDLKVLAKDTLVRSMSDGDQIFPIPGGERTPFAHKGLLVTPVDFVRQRNEPAQVKQGSNFNIAVALGHTDKSKRHPLDITSADVYRFEEGTRTLYFGAVREVLLKKSLAEALQINAAWRGGKPYAPPKPVEQRSYLAGVKVDALEQGAKAITFLATINDDELAKGEERVLLLEIRDRGLELDALIYNQKSMRLTRRIWDTKAGSVVEESVLSPSVGKITGASWSEDCNTILCIIEKEGKPTLQMFEATPGQAREPVEIPLKGTFVRAEILSRKYLLVSGGDRGIQLLRVDTLEEVKNFGPGEFRVSPSRKQLIVMPAKGRSTQEVVFEVIALNLAK